jgi:hypothetical protein
MKIILIFTSSFLITILSGPVFSHDLRESDDQFLKEWHLKAGHFKGAFLYAMKGSAVFDLGNHQLKTVQIKDLSQSEQLWVNDQINKIKAINQKHIESHSHAAISTNSKEDGSLVFLLVLSGVIFIIAFYLLPKQTWSFSIVAFVAGFITIGFVLTVKTSKGGIEKSTSPSFIDSAFAPFVPNIHTFWDSQYFYVESQGIPNTHEMMVGISDHGWQQQVPIPQCYIGQNAWPIPLNPIIAATPTPIDAVHFTRGAIAIAVNGVPIFNYHTNTGVDSYLDGQLDNYGGHCGRGDDYHYHIAPLHLYAHTQATLPIAFGLDGFAVYGSVEPNGSAMQSLDANHGHYGANGVYHYHGTSTAPYMIGSFVGQVTEDATHQLIPQAQASPVRTENWTPLNGALITACTPNGSNNGYNLSYTLNGVSGYATNYSWNGTTYSFNYITPSGTTTQTYNGFIQCLLTTGIKEQMNENIFDLYPNPTQEYFTIDLNTNQVVKGISVYSITGKLMYQNQDCFAKISTENFPKGVYLVEVRTKNALGRKKLIID